MKCYKCHRGTQVKDSRKFEGNTIRRRRYCNHCKQGFFSIEIMYAEYSRLKNKPIQEPEEQQKTVTKTFKQPGIKPKPRTNEWEALHEEDRDLTLRDLGLK